jgi:hypothetical protein
MKYFIYTRKSTDSEERQILSIEAQLAELKEFAAKEKLEIVLFASASRRGGRKGGLGGIPPAEQVARKISSDFFKYTPPKSKIGIEIRNRVAFAVRHKNISAKNSRIQKGTKSVY